MSNETIPLNLFKANLELQLRLQRRVLVRQLLELPRRLRREHLLQNTHNVGPAHPWRCPLKHHQPRLRLAP